MPPTNRFLGLVELVNRGGEDTGNKATSQIMHDVFGHRLNDWLTSNDQWSFLNDNRACVILRDIDSTDELEMAAAELDSAFKEPHYHLGQALPLAVTAGFTEFNDQTSDLAQAMQEAGIALNQAKQSENLFQIFTGAQTEALQQECGRLREMELALKSNEFQLHYQPKVHAGLRTLIGAEALIHWHHSEHGIMSPDEFVEVASRHDIMKPIMRWAIKSAVSRLARWPDQLSIALDICPSLLDEDMLSLIKDALTAFDVKPSRLNLEISEHLGVGDQTLMLSQLCGLHETGVTISIDNFGTGSSALAHFRDLPIDEVKIDKSFIERMLVSNKDYAIVKTIIDLAHSFSLKVVAEGVNSIEIADRLTEMHCDILQGNAFDKPLCAEEFALEYRI
ncbi:Phytochrome-like protein cph2 [Halioglobus japonicus]|nr:Phytochrome-like protein cph2 [Halioglobus japonicus]